MLRGSSCAHTSSAEGEYRENTRVSSAAGNG